MRGVFIVNHSHKTVEAKLTAMKESALRQEERKRQAEKEQRARENNLESCGEEEDIRKKKYLPQKMMLCSF